mmetsp:Transcript_86/g.120  ORF Transcript_86/g.120 Transcript_86/m.120 type:complete len:110 (-) Transcript_86:120-449(-)
MEHFQKLGDDEEEQGGGGEVTKRSSPATSSVPWEQLCGAYRVRPAESESGAEIVIGSLEVERERKAKSVFQVPELMPWAKVFGSKRPWTPVVVWLGFVFMLWCFWQVTF